MEKMTDKELLYVKTIIEESSVTRAAAKLYIAQPSLSQAIQKIEASLGIRLFVRTSQGLQPTRDGMKYYEAANHILRTYNGLMEEIGRNIEGVERIKVGTTTILSNFLFENICPKFWKKHPQVRVHIWEDSVHSVLQKLEDGELHMAVLHAHASDLSDDFCFHLIQEDFPVLIVNADLCHFQSITGDEGEPFREIDPAEVKGYPYIRYEDENYYCDFVEKGFRKAGIQLNANIFLTTNSPYTAIRMVCASKGYTFCPRSCIPGCVPRNYIFKPSGLSFPDFHIYAIWSELERGGRSRKLVYKVYPDRIGDVGKAKSNRESVRGKYTHFYRLYRPLLWTYCIKYICCE